MTARHVRIVLGLLLVALGAYLVFSPLLVASMLGRPHETASQMINLRASWGGTGVGLGAWIAWLPALRPWRRSIVGLATWAMAGIGFARGVGFVLDGSPDLLQWIWMIAEIVIVVGGAIVLRRMARKLSPAR